VSRKLITAAVTVSAIVGAVALGGCGATKTIGSAVDPVARAAEVTSHSPGYRLSGTITVSGAAATVHGTMSGVIDTADHTGSMTMHETVLGHSLTIAERLAGTTIYMGASGQPELARLTGGKHWLKMDLNRALGTLGFSGLPTQTTDPSQFVQYLRAVSARTTRVGTETIDGTQATHYHAVIDLDKYPMLFAPAQRQSAAQGIANMEAIMGSHTLPMDVWIDSQQHVRRLSFSFTECIQNQHLTMAMTMNMSDYGQQSVAPAPPASQTYDLTPLIVKAMKSVKLTCSTTA
jgi:hypothetical protein